MIVGLPQIVCSGDHPEGDGNQAEEGGSDDDCACDFNVLIVEPSHHDREGSCRHRSLEEEDLLQFKTADTQLGDHNEQEGQKNDSYHDSKNQRTPRFGKVHFRNAVVNDGAAQDESHRNGASSKLIAHAEEGTRNPGGEAELTDDKSDGNREKWRTKYDPLPRLFETLAADEIEANAPEGDVDADIVNQKSYDATRIKSLREGEGNVSVVGDPTAKSKSPLLAAIHHPKPSSQILRGEKRGEKTKGGQSCSKKGRGPSGKVDRKLRIGHDPIEEECWKQHIRKEARNRVIPFVGQDFKVARKCTDRHDQEDSEHGRCNVEELIVQRTSL